MNTLLKIVNGVVISGVVVLTSACGIDPVAPQSFAPPVAQANDQHALYQFSGKAIFAAHPPAGGSYVYVSFHEGRMSVSGVFAELIPLHPGTIEALYFPPGSMRFDLVFDTDVAPEHYLDASGSVTRLRCSTAERELKVLTPCSSQFARANAADESTAPESVYRYDEARISANLEMLLDHDSQMRIAQLNPSPAPIDATGATTYSSRSRPSYEAAPLQLSQQIATVKALQVSLGSTTRSAGAASYNGVRPKP